jgi:ribonuclease P protein component
LKAGFSFRKVERISSRKEIDLLFEKGKSFTIYPLRVVYAEKAAASGVAASVLISVPKKKFKRAVHRNRLKRLIRENYRLRKNALLAVCRQENREMNIGFIYAANEQAATIEIAEAMQKILLKMTEIIASK